MFNYLCRGNIITRGEDAGAYAMGGFSFKSWLGSRGISKGVDAYANIGAVGAWRSLSDSNSLTWIGTTAGIGFGAGGSVGLGNTTLLKGMKF